MSVLGDGAAAGKVLGILKDLPLWLLAALAIAADVLFFVPAVRTELPKEFQPWLVVTAVLFNVLAVARFASLSLRAWNGFRASAVARRTFHMSPDSGQSFWGTARQRDDSMNTQVVVRFLVKNLTSKPLGLVAVRLIKPKMAGEVVHADVMVRAVKSNMYGSVHSGHLIPSGIALPATASVMIKGIPRQSPAETLHVTLGVTDDEGNERRLRLPIRGTGLPKTEVEMTPPREPIFSISNPLEKEIVSVLQAELDRYQKFGRERGGLGSVHIVYHGRAQNGVGGDSWDPNSPKGQSITDDSDAAALHSDNLDALLTLHQQLTTDQEKGKFAAALLERLNDKKSYLSVSYFIVCTLWKTGHLKEALAKARVDLQEDERKAFGLSNVLMMFNGLLRYRHPDFTPDMLDEIEGFVHQLKKEHTFQIAEKIAAIRTRRLLARNPSG